MAVGKLIEIKRHVHLCACMSLRCLPPTHFRQAYGMHPAFNSVVALHDEILRAYGLHAFRARRSKV
jgi:hypothetical protein